MCIDKHLNAKSPAHQRAKAFLIILFWRKYAKN